jgi:hypothetical protein
MVVRCATMARAAGRRVPSESGGQRVGGCPASLAVQPWKRQTMLPRWSVFHPLWHRFKCFNQICSPIGLGLGIALYDSL